MAENRPSTIYRKHKSRKLDIKKGRIELERTLQVLRHHTDHPFVRPTWIITSVIPSWTFYTMPHSLLSSLGDARPERPYWPRPGENEVDVILRGINILARGRNGALHRSWASSAKIDGYSFSPKEDAKEAKIKKETKPKKKEGKAASEPPMVKQETPKEDGPHTAVRCQSEKCKC